MQYFIRLITVETEKQLHKYGKENGGQQTVIDHNISLLAKVDYIIVNQLPRKEVVLTIIQRQFFLFLNENVQCDPSFRTVSSRRF